jgi:Mg2+-importing ATPase
MQFSNYAIQNKEVVLKDLGTSENGISEKEAKERQKNYGLNEISFEKVTPFNILLRQFKSSFVYLLLIAAFVAFFIGEGIDSLFILLFVLINVTLGFFQEFRAERAVKILKSYLPAAARVKREGKEKIIDKKFLVPGDIVLLEAGNIVPADVRLLKESNLLVDESILSGESTLLSKSTKTLSQKPKDFFEATNILFEGTAVISGKAEGVVILTGKNTSFGEIARISTKTKKVSLYEKRLLYFSKIVLRIVVATITIVYLLNLLITHFNIFNRGQINNLDFLIFSIALLVSIIPEALPVVATFSFSRGALKLAKKKVVIKKLSSIEALGNIDILCSDKTGTLTEGKLSLENIFSPNKEKCLLFGLLSSPYVRENIETSITPFDLAIFKETTEEIRSLLKKFHSIAEIPFDSFRMKSSVLIEDEKGKRILIVKGAPETILKICSQWEGSLNEKDVKKKIKEEGKEGKRILALAYREFEKDSFSENDEKGLRFLGYFSFTDPLKKTAKEAVNLSQKLGVKIKILTGDSLEVAASVAKSIGLINKEDEVILGEDLENIEENDFEKKCESFSVFARVSPLMKLKIVNSLQKKYEVGFLGEGINDAPVLKAANVSIAVKEGAEISREVSDIILLKKDLHVIVEGIKEGRNIFYNIQKYIKNTLSSNFGNFFSVATVSLFIPFLPMLPIQILLVNILTDFPLIAIATDTIDAQELRKPKLYQLHQIISLIILLAIVSSIFDFIFFALFYQTGEQFLQTLWFIGSILTEIVLIFSLRTRHLFFKAKKPSFTLSFLSFLAVVLAILLPFTEFGKEFFHFISPPPSTLLLLFFIVIGYFVVSEAVKLIYFRNWRLKHLKNY